LLFTAADGELADRRFLTMQLYYTDTCDPEYEPTGFSAGTDDQRSFAEGKGWKKHTQKFGPMGSGYHTWVIKQDVC